MKKEGIYGYFFSAADLCRSALPQDAALRMLEKVRVAVPDAHCRVA